ncbi:MAG: hypothetical protein CMI09_04245 [Oceanospirillaceae bacterium]|nr:hypothetical protein [Oceanospirillaceae bacterium]
MLIRLLFTALVLSSNWSLADSSNVSDKSVDTIPVDDNAQMETPITPGMVERSRYWLAGYLDELSAGLDSFFVDSFFSENIIEDDIEGSRAKLSFYTRRELGDPVDYKFGLSVRLVFPNTNERLNLLLESEDEEAREADPLESVENNNYSAALRFIIQESDRWKTNLDSGVRWGIPPDPFSRLRARRFFGFWDWEAKATQTLYYYTSKGWGERTSLQLNRSLNTEKLLRLNGAAEYLLNDEYFKLNYDLGVYHELSHRAAMGYVAGASGDTQSSATFYDYFASVRYRRLIYKDWVFAEVAPALVWESNKDYETTPVIMFRIESVISR